jgi:phosphotransferase system enzyme I (PtsI)
MKKRSNTVKKEITIDGVRVVSGLAIGPAFPFRRTPLKLEDISYNVADIPGELERFEKACQSTVDMLKRAKELSLPLFPDEVADIFDSQIALVQDKIFLQEIVQEIKNYRCSAAEAVSRIFKKKKEYFLGMENQYFRERAHDIEDLKRKILNSLFGIGEEYQLSIPSVIFAENLFPSDTVHFNRNSILGFVTDAGGRTSHASIIARSFGIPYVINNENISQFIKETDIVILDGYAGKIVLNPDETTISEYKKYKKKYIRIEKRLEKESTKPTITTDGTTIQVLANVEFYDEVADALKFGAEGIGLFRTEGIFFEKDELPDEEEQYQLYKRFADALGARRLVLRTIDAGGDKIIPELKDQNELNPFLGWRAIRFCLDQPHIFETQLRAILRANVNGNIKILIPMISCIREIWETKRIIEKVKTDLENTAKEFNASTQLGIMIETPAAALLSDVYGPEVDFMSIGTNDLTQYTLAVDRTNLKIAALFNDLHPAVLRLIRETIFNAQKHRVDLSICGEIAGNPLAIGALIGLGIRQFSMSPKLIPVIKKVIRSISLSDCELLTKHVIKCKSADEVETYLVEFREQFIPEDLILI